MPDNSKITERLLSDKNMLEKDYNPLGVFLVGSQNYGLDYEKSDIDTKAILIPCFKNFCLDQHILSTVYHFENKEQIDIKDIRSMFKCFLKQHINFLEILFTDYKVIDKKYWHYFTKLYNKREEIAHYNPYKAINSMYGNMKQKKSRLTKVTPSTQDFIENYGYNPKELHHILRLEEFIIRYLNGESYQNCLKSNQKDYLVDIKENPLKYTNNYNEIASKCCNNIENRISFYTADSFKINTEISDFLNDILLEIFKISFKEDILGETV